MVNKSRAVLTILVLSIALTANAACESVVRDLPDTPVGPDDEITIGLTQYGFLLNVVEVTEYLPEGFVYVSGSYTGSSYAPVYNPGDNTLVMMLAGADEITVTYNATTGTVTQIYNTSSWGFLGLYDGFVGFKHVTGGVTGDASLISDTTPPTIDSVTLAPTVVAVGDPILVTVDATDDVRIASVGADGVELTESGDVWTGTIIAEEGTHFVCISAYDTSGNVGWNNSTSYTTTIADTTDPIVNSVTLNRTDVTTGDPILVTVDATDNVGVDGVTAEGVELTQNSDIWTGVIIAEEGTHTVNVCARDAVGNVAWNNSTSYTATDPDTESPVVNSVELNETEVTTGDPILVTVDATDNVGVDGVTAEGVELTQSSDIWTGVIIAEAGTHTVNVCATDGAGNTGWNNSTSYTTTTADTTDPIVNSVTLNRTEVTDGDPILVTVNATDDTGVVSVTAEGVALTPLPGNIWEGIIIAATGNDVVVNVCAMDGADNTGWNNSTSYNARWIREDVYPDGEITIADIVRVGNCFGEAGEPGWIPEDVWPDGEITIADIVRVGNCFGETNPQ